MCVWLFKEIFRRLTILEFVEMIRDRRTQNLREFTSLGNSKSQLVFIDTCERVIYYVTDIKTGSSFY